MHEALLPQFLKAAPDTAITHHPSQNKASTGSDTGPASIEVPANPPACIPELTRQENSKEVQQQASGFAVEECSPFAESSVPDHEEAGIKPSEENLIPPIEYMTDSPQLCRDQGSEENDRDGANADEWWESSPGLDVLVDHGSEQLAYEEDKEYLLAPERESKLLHGSLLQYDYEVPPGYDPVAYSDAGFMYEHGVYDGYDQRDIGLPEYLHKVSGYSSEKRDLETTRRRRKPSRRRRGIADGRDFVDLRDHLRKRSRTDVSPHKYYSSRSREQSRERLKRHQTRPLLHGRFASEVGNNMHGSARRETEFALSDSYGRGWLGYHQSSRHARSRVREREFRRQRRPPPVPSSEILRRFSSKRAESSHTNSSDVTFSGPKTLAQIKEEKRRAREADRHGPGSRIHKNSRRREPEYFESPKPLSELLKAKRRARLVNGNTGSSAGMSSGDEQHVSGDKEQHQSGTLEKKNDGYGSDFADDDYDDDDEDEDAVREKLVHILSS